MGWEIAFLVLCVAIAVLLVVFRNTFIVKKYWRYALILLPFVVIVTIQLIIKIKTGGKTTSGEADGLQRSISDLKDNLQEAHNVTTIEVTASKAKDVATLQKLQQVRAIADKDERTKQLAAMMG